MSGPNIPVVTDQERARWPAHGVVKLEKPFVDVRGKIQPLVDEIMQLGHVPTQSKKASTEAKTMVGLGTFEGLARGRHRRCL